MQYYVYVLRCRNGSYYTGLTSNIKRRIEDHKKGLSLSTKNVRPIKLKFFGCFPDKFIAARFEKYLKSHSGIAFRNKRLVHTAEPQA